MEGNNKQRFGNLDRIYFLGVSSEKIKLDISFQSVYKSGFLVKTIYKDSPAQKSAIKINDIIVQIDKYLADDFKNISYLIRQIKTKTVLIKIIRNDNLLTKLVVLEKKPLETSLNFDIDYSSFQVGGYNVRTIITTPKQSGSKSQQFPVILFIQGIKCDSIDYPFNNNHPYKKLLYEFTELGYITVRIERFGSGDSEGPYPEDMTFSEELKLFDEAITYASQIDYVDSSRIYLFGYSMGGFIAPIIASNHLHDIKGIIVFGTFFSKFSEYCIKNLIRQHRLKGLDKVTIQDQVLELSDLLNLLLNKKYTPNQIIRKKPSYEKFFSYEKYIFGHNYTYFQELEDIVIANYWNKINISVIIIAGKNDFVIDYQDHINLFKFLYNKNRNKSIRMLTPNVDHNFCNKSINENDNGPFSYATVKHICDYLNNSNFAHK